MPYNDLHISNIISIETLQELRTTEPNETLRLREAGNNLFKAKKYEDAKGLYYEALKPC